MNQCHHDFTHQIQDGCFARSCHYKPASCRALAGSKRKFDCVEGTHIILASACYHRSNVHMAVSFQSPQKPKLAICSYRRFLPVRSRGTSKKSEELRIKNSPS